MAHRYASVPMSSPELRPLTSDDLPAVCAMHQRALTHDGVPQLLQLDELEEELDDEHVVLATDTRLATSTASWPATPTRTTCPARCARNAATSSVRSTPRSAAGVWARRSCGGGSNAAPNSCGPPGRALPRYLRAHTNDYIVGAVALFEHVGMTARFATARSCCAPSPTCRRCTFPTASPSFPWPDDRDEEIRIEKNIAFADHWGSTPTVGAPLGAGGPRLRRPARSVVHRARRRGPVIGHCLNKRFETDDELLGRSDAWIENLGTLPEWRGRGHRLVAHRPLAARVRSGRAARTRPSGSTATTPPVPQAVQATRLRHRATQHHPRVRVD